MLGVGLNASHGEDINFIFHNTNHSANDFALATTMQNYWGSFARTGSPQDAGVAWPKYDSASLQTMRFDVPKSTIVQNVKQDVHNFWRKLFPVQLEVVKDRHWEHHEPWLSYLVEGSRPVVLTYLYIWQMSS